MTIKFHISNDILLSYSAGTLDEASSLLVATHLALCPHCRARNSSADALGGYLLDSLEATAVLPTMMASVLSQVRSDTTSPEPKEPSRSFSNAIIPDPLRSYLGGDLSDLHWKRLAPRVQQISIDTLDNRSFVRFQTGAHECDVQTRFWQYWRSWPALAPVIRHRLSRLPSLRSGKRSGPPELSRYPFQAR